MTDAISSTLANLNAAGTRQTSNSFGSLDQSDFLRLLTVQLQQQDPLEPVDNKEMLAQMAQFSGLAGTNETNSRLANMSDQLAELIAAQRS